MSPYYREAHLTKLHERAVSLHEQELFYQGLLNNETTQTGAAMLTDTLAGIRKEKREVEMKIRYINDERERVKA